MSDKKNNLMIPLLLYFLSAAGLLILPQLIPLLAPLTGGMSVCTQLLIYSCIYYIPFVAVPALIVLRKQPARRAAARSEGFSLWHLPAIILLAANMFFLSNDLTVLWAIPFQKIGVNIYALSNYSPANAAELTLCVVTSAAIPAVCEELLFRGILLPAFEPYGTKRAIIITSIMFAMLHGQIIGLPAEFFAGIVIACIVLAADSICAAMVFHTAYNAISLLIDYMHPGESGGDLWTQLNGISGVLSLMLTSLLCAACVLLLLRGMLRRAKTIGDLRVVSDKTPIRLTTAEIILAFLSAIAVLVLYIISTMQML